MSLDHYERRAVNDIRAWVAGERGQLDEFAKTVGSATGRLTRPLEWAVDRALADPRVGQSVDRAMDGIGRFMANTTPARSAADTYGLQHQEHIADLHLKEIDEQLARVRNHHRAVFVGLGAMEGAAGFAGTPTALAAFIASIPAMQAASLRAVSDVSRHVGFDPQDFHERQFVAEVTFRSLDFGDEETLERLLSLGHGRQALDQFAIISALREQAERFGLLLTRRRAAALMPFVGAAVGAGFNAVYVERLMNGSMMLYRARHLSRQHGIRLADLTSKAA